jgi:hypothetical protein
MGFSVFKAKERTAGRRENRKANVNAWDETDKMADQKSQQRSRLSCFLVDDADVAKQGEAGSYAAGPL